MLWERLFTHDIIRALWGQFIASYTRFETGNDLNAIHPGI